MARIIWGKESDKVEVILFQIPYYIQHRFKNSGVEKRWKGGGGGEVVPHASFTSDTPGAQIIIP